MPKIIIGYRSREGHLLNIDEVETQKIPSTVQRVGRFKWNGNVCINFTGELLDFFKHTIVGDGVWRITRTAGAVEVFKMEEHGTGGILCQKFLDWRTSQQ